jgi:hypothetical protein
MTTFVRKGEYTMFPRGPRPPMGPMMNMRGMNSMMPYGGQPMNRGLGGILSKLFSKSGTGAVAKQSGMLNPFINQPVSQGTGGFISNLLSNPGNMMNNLQRVMNVANQVGPMVQQYGPMVRNIPALIKLYSELNSSEDGEEEGQEMEAKDVPKPKKQAVSKETKQGTSTPRLYV